MAFSDQSEKRKAVNEVDFSEVVEVIKNDNIVQLLIWLDDGSIPNVDVRSGPDFEYSSLLIMASKLGKINAVRLLLKYGASINRANGVLNTPIDVACHAGHLDIVILLHNRGADVDNPGILRLTCRNDHVEIVRYLLDHGTDISRNLRAYGKALVAACKSGHLKVAQLLVERGAYVNYLGDDYEDEEDRNPLTAACYGNHFEVAKYLVSIGADPLVAAPLASLCDENVELINYLLENGADIDAFDRESNPLLRASEFGLVENVKALLERGADVHIRNTVQWNATPLIRASMMLYNAEYVPTIKLLLDYGADTNDVDANGDSALIRLLKTSTRFTEGDLECVRLLLQYGADVTLTNLAGQTASSLVEAGSAICNLLEEYRDQNDRELLAVRPLVK